MAISTITNKIRNESTLVAFNKLAKQYSKIIVAVAFFSDSKILDGLLQAGKEITLIVSLRPPTNYYSLKQLLHRENIEILFLGDEFHSKIFAFYNDGGIESAIIGSSNFTNGGLSNNIETNVVITSGSVLNEIDLTLDEIIEISTELQPDELNNYKERYDSYAKFQKTNKSTVKLKKTTSSVKISKKASEYTEFWEIADKVKDIVGDIADPVEKELVAKRDKNLHQVMENYISKIKGLVNFDFEFSCNKQEIRLFSGPISISLEMKKTKDPRLVIKGNMFKNNYKMVRKIIGRQEYNMRIGEKTSDRAYWDDVTPEKTAAIMTATYNK